ncbi:Microcystin-dependent protein [Filimonas lacunae]|uniref:Microcystin-dependent protein n=1 Tax=Filimonas lacunae TaxID=477680 RepID=A0A173M9U9_9BACT|nr:tail fiber protein [Filimonas lacunae]BAV04317.1 microcystin dependent protein [Filimonas lacunae]SIT31003.1 Microcystin-dependent protein [Filimonas lacunae]
MQGTIGEIRMFGGTFAPTGWMLCQGQQLNLNDFQTVYAVMGTTFGGDGVNSFLLPALGGRVPIGTGQRPGGANVVIGQVMGTEQVTLTTANLPQHSHTPTFTLNNTAVGASVSMKAATTAGATTPVNNNLGTDAATAFYATATAGTRVPLAASSVPVTGFAGPNPTITLSVFGNSLPHDNMQPYTAVNYIVCVYGVFPSRN